MVLTSGIGTLLGSVLAGEVFDRFAGDYVTIFLVPCLIDLTLLIYFLRSFDRTARTQTGPKRLAIPTPGTTTPCVGQSLASSIS